MERAGTIVLGRNALASGDAATAALAACNRSDLDGATITTQSAREYFEDVQSTAAAKRRHADALLLEQVSICVHLHLHNPLSRLLASWRRAADGEQAHDHDHDHAYHAYGHEHSHP